MVVEWSNLIYWEKKKKWKKEIIQIRKKETESEHTLPSYYLAFTKDSVTKLVLREGPPLTLA